MADPVVELGAVTRIRTTRTNNTQTPVTGRRTASKPAVARPVGWPWRVRWSCGDRRTWCVRSTGRSTATRGSQADVPALVHAGHPPRDFELHHHPLDRLLSGVVRARASAGKRGEFEVPQPTHAVVVSLAPKHDGEAHGVAVKRGVGYKLRGYGHAVGLPLQRAGQWWTGNRDGVKVGSQRAPAAAPESCQALPARARKVARAATWAAFALHGAGEELAKRPRGLLRADGVAVGR